MLTQNEKAVSNLESLDVDTKIENDSVYVIIGSNELELSEFEIKYQADEFDKKKEE